MITDLPLCDRERVDFINGGSGSLYSYRGRDRYDNYDMQRIVPYDKLLSITCTPSSRNVMVEVVREVCTVERFNANTYAEAIDFNIVRLTNRHIATPDKFASLSLEIDELRLLEPAARISTEPWPQQISMPGIGGNWSVLI